MLVTGTGFLVGPANGRKAALLHHDVPYGFKPWCFKQAEEAGYRRILWLDGSAKAAQSLDPLFDELGERGYLFFENWHSAGAYCHDHALFTLGVDRLEAMKIPSINGQVMALNLDFPNAKAFLDIWHAKSLDRITFQDHGLRNIVNEKYIQQTGVKGHRHDQTAASIIAWKLGMLNFRFKISDFFMPRPGEK